MRKQLLIAICLLLGIEGAKAQFNYSITVLNQAYMPLSGATTSLNGSNIWDDEDYLVTLAFPFKVNGIVTNQIGLIAGQIAATDTNYSTTPITGFVMVGADIYDRGNAAGGMSRSPIRYQYAGTAPNRIFKLEVYNAGFYDEGDVYGTDNDSISYQIWLYETSNVFEIHYGPSLISHAGDYFSTNGKPNVGFFKNINLNTGAVDMFYYLEGAPSSPTLDSTNNLITLADGLNTYPSNGTVYRFAPPTVGVTDIAAGLKNVDVYPTICTDKITVAHNEQKLSYQIISLSGALLSSQGTLHSGVDHIDISSLPAGLYMLNLQSDKGRKVVRFTKN
jgi:hypothetical protein